MSCNCGCNSGCGCDPNPCHKPCTTTSTTSTTTIPCIGEQCDELYDCECVRYIGEDLLCYGIKNGTTLCEIIQIINDEICKLGPVATTTLRDCRFGTLTATILTTTTTIAPTTTTSSTSTTTSSTTSTTTVSCTYNGGNATVVLPTTPAPTTIPPAPTTTTTIDEPIGPIVTTTNNQQVNCNCYEITNVTDVATTYSYVKCNGNFSITIGLGAFEIRRICAVGTPSSTVTVNVLPLGTICIDDGECQ